MTITGELLANDDSACTAASTQHRLPQVPIGPSGRVPAAWGRSGPLPAFPGTDLRLPPAGMPFGPEGGHHGRPDIALIAGAIAQALRSGTTTLREPTTDPVRRTSVLARSTPDYDVWLLRWPHGTRVDPHDHRESAAAFSVVSGELLEVRWREGQPGFRRVKGPAVVQVEAGVVHDVVGATPSALSVHVYSPPLSAMGFYDPTGTRLIRVGAVDHETPQQSGVVARNWIDVADGPATRSDSY